MTITHESMMTLTAPMPMKQIVINGEVYLERYFAHTLPAGTQLVHRYAETQRRSKSTSI